MYRSKEHPFVIADVDRLIVGEDAGLECKTASVYNADKWADGNIPLHYVMQCYHYMAVTGKRVWYIAAVILGREFTYRRLEWDDELIGRLIAIEDDFWNHHIVQGARDQKNGLSLLLYKDAKVDQRILDETFGPFGWKRSHQSIEGNLYCTVEIYDRETGEWIAKQDVGTTSYSEKERGRLPTALEKLQDWI